MVAWIIDDSFGWDTRQNNGVYHNPWTGIPLLNWLVLRDNTVCPTLLKHQESIGQWHNRCWLPIEPICFSFTTLLQRNIRQGTCLFQRMIFRRTRHCLLSCWNRYQYHSVLPEVVDLVSVWGIIDHANATLEVRRHIWVGTGNMCGAFLK